MILVDTSVWIDHLHASDSRLEALLVNDQVGCHPLVIEELALGSIARRDLVLELLASLAQFPVVTHEEVLHLVDSRRLWGRGLSAVDASLLGSVRVLEGGQLWTSDKPLQAACIELGTAYADDE